MFHTCVAVCGSQTGRGLVLGSIDKFEEEPLAEDVSSARVSMEKGGSDSGTGAGKKILLL